MARFLAQSAENLGAITRLAAETIASVRRDIEAAAQAAGLLSQHLAELADDLERRTNGGGQ